MLAGSGLAALFIVMLLKEIGVPVPIPSDLIMITAGVQLAAGAFGPIELVVVLSAPLAGMMANRQRAALVERAVA